MANTDLIILFIDLFLVRLLLLHLRFLFVEFVLNVFKVGLYESRRLQFLRVLVDIESL